MIPIRIVETERADFEGPVVELWREAEFVGMVFWDGEVPVVQIHPTEDGDVHDLEVENLVHVLDTARTIVDPHAFDDDLADIRMATSALRGGGGDTWDDEHPATVELVGEFDPKAAHRSEDGEGFFGAGDAGDFIRRCEELDLAVVEMEGFDLDRGGALHPRPGLELVIRPQEVMGWPEFRSYANATALDTLSDWTTRDSLVFAFVVQQPDGETFVA